jgi:hypothetical protein
MLWLKVNEHVKVKAIGLFNPFFKSILSIFSRVLGFPFSLIHQRYWIWIFYNLKGHICHNPSFGLMTKVRACKVAGQEGNLIVKESVKEWTLTLPKEVPLWELESQWILECSKSDCKGQNSMTRRVLYTIGKLFKCRCLKWAHMTHLDIWNTSYGQ